MKFRIVVFLTLLAAGFTSEQVSAHDGVEAGIVLHVHFGYPHFPPFAYYVEDSICAGLFCDTLSELFTQKLKFDLQAVQRPWKRIQLEVKGGNIDVMLGVPTETRMAYALASELPLFKIEMRVYTRADHPKLAQIKNIKSVANIEEIALSSITNLGNGWHRDKIQAQGVRTIHVSTDELVLLMLAAGRGDIVIDATPSVRQKLVALNLQEKIIETNVVLGITHVHLLMSKKSTLIEMMPEINRMIKEIVPAEF